MLEQPGHHHGCPHDLIWVYHHFEWNAGDDWWTALHGFLPHRICVISVGGVHRGLWSDMDWCGINSWGSVVAASVFVVAHAAVTVGWPSLWVADRDLLRWTLLLCACLLSDSWRDSLHQLWQVYFHPFGWCCGHEDISFCKIGEWLHCPLEFLYPPCQAVRLAGDWGMHILSPML